MPIRVKGQTSDRHPRREWNSPERRKKRQEEYMEKHGPQEPRRKRLATEDKYKEVREKLKDRGGFKPLRAAKAKGGKAGTGPSPGTRIKARKARAAEWWTGREGMQAVYNPTLDKKLREKRPHSSPEGRMRDVKTAYAKAAAEHKKIKDSGIKRKWGKPKQYGGGAKTAQRAKHGLGSLVKKGISKILKPKGVFKPKPVPKAVTDKPFKYDETYTRADDKKIKSMLTKLGDEIKAQPLPSKLKKTMKKLQKAYPHKKAEGGRIGLKHGKFVRAAVPHADIDKYVDKGTGKEDDRKGNRSRVEGSTMKFKKPKKSRGPSAGRQAAGQNRAGRQARRSTYQGGGRIGLKHGGSVGAAVRGHGAEIK